MESQARSRIIQIFKMATGEPVKDWSAYSKYKNMLLELNYTPDEYNLVIGILVDILEL